MSALHTTLSTPEPPVPLDNVELAEYVRELRRRVEILNIQIEELVLQNAAKDTEIDRLSLDLGIRDAGQWPSWQKVTT